MFIVFLVVMALVNLAYGLHGVATGSMLLGTLNLMAFGWLAGYLIVEVQDRV